jgi:hypothetical protein
LADPIKSTVCTFRAVAKTITKALLFHILFEALDCTLDSAHNSLRISSVNLAHLIYSKGFRIVCVLGAGPSPQSLHPLDTTPAPPQLHTRNIMAAPNERPRRVSMAYVLGFSKTPFKDPNPPPPPPQLRRPTGVDELVSRSGTLAFHRLST